MITIILLCVLITLIALQAKNYQEAFKNNIDQSDQNLLYTMCIMIIVFVIAMNSTITECREDAIKKGAAYYDTTIDPLTGDVTKKEFKYYNKPNKLNKNNKTTN